MDSNFPFRAKKATFKASSEVDPIDRRYGVFGLSLLRKIAAVLSWSAIRSSLSRADAEQRRRQTGRGR
jgi:hypothetical protein